MHRIKEDDMVKKLKDKIGLTTHDDPKKPTFKYPIINKKDANEIKPHQTIHSICVQRGKYLKIENENQHLIKQYQMVQKEPNIKGMINKD